MEKIIVTWYSDRSAVPEGCNDILVGLRGHRVEGDEGPGVDQGQDGGNDDDAGKENPVFREDGRKPDQGERCQGEQVPADVTVGNEGNEREVDQDEQGHLPLPAFPECNSSNGIDDEENPVELPEVGIAKGNHDTKRLLDKSAVDREVGKKITE